VLKADIEMLFDYNYWANGQVVACAAQLSSEQFIQPSKATWRGLRGTLVHTLDVERSWRLKLRGEPREIWDTSLRDEDYPTVEALAVEWKHDEAEMRRWLSRLGDAELANIADLGGNDRFPLWYFLLHIITHSTQQRRDAIILMTPSGRVMGELDFLYYADSLRSVARVNALAR
jgi:uncharacterized damage-inducible protein DinB